MYLKLICQYMHENLHGIIEKLHLEAVSPPCQLNFSVRQANVSRGLCREGNNYEKIVSDFINISVFFTE